ncbi:MAG: permease-like cell division protein FtsX [Patescibacteria group bacterium]|nr:permease-like cell division protein FtsX [Patescibacteria group bacterium]
MFIVTSTVRVLAFAWKNFTRNAWIGLATIIVLILSLLSVNVLLGVNAVSDAALHELEDKVDVSVYLKPETPAAILETARSYMASLPQTQSVELLDADKALADFKERHKDDPKVLAALDELDQNPLGASLVIKAKKTEDYPFLIEALQNPQFSFAVESKTYDDNSASIDRVQHIAQTVRFVGLILIVLFSVFSTLIVYNSIRIAIYTQREELGIMRLVGASNAIVRLPLILSGVFQAVLAFVFAGGLVFLALVFFDPKLRILFDGADPGMLTYFVNNFWTLAGIQLAAIVALVALASWAAAGKYLKK